MGTRKSATAIACIQDEASCCSALRRLLGPDSDLCDFAFIVGEQRERLLAVRAICAVRSAPLRSMLFDQTFRRSEHELELPQWSPSAFRHMLEFLHGGATNVDPDTVLELLQLSDFFQVDDLKSLCKAYLADNLSADTVSTLLAEAERLNDEHLRTKCKEFFLANARNALLSPTVGVLPEATLCELLRDDALSTDEWSVYQAVKRWAAAQSPYAGALAEDMEAAASSASLGHSASSCEEQVELVAAAVAPNDDEVPALLVPSAALVLAAAAPLRCVRLGQLSAEQLRAVRADGLVGEGPLLDAALSKLDGRQIPQCRRRIATFAFRFDVTAKGDGVQVDRDRETATFTKDNCVLGDVMLPDHGQAYWEVLVVSGTNAYVGIARRERIDVQRNMGSGGGIAFRGIGGNEKWKECSHFEYGRRVGRSERVGVLVDLPARSISFYVNGEPLGVAFDNLDPAKRYWPCVSNNTGEMKLVLNPRLPP